MRGLLPVAAAVVAFALLFVGGCTPAGRQAIAVVTGDTAQARVEAYLRALERGDEPAALAAWQPGDRHAYLAQIRARRDRTTAALDARGLRSYTIDAIEWWRTCCEPGVVQGGDTAEGARVKAILRFGDGTSGHYVLDVFATDVMTTFQGLPSTGWTLRDVYRSDEDPLYFRFTSTGFFRGAP